MQEYEQNFNENQHEKQANIEEINSLIGEKEEEIDQMVKKKEYMRGLLHQMLQHKYGLYLKRVAFKSALDFRDLSKRKKRLAAYTQNYMHRRKMRLWYQAWRGISFNWGRERI